MYTSTWCCLPHTLPTHTPSCFCLWQDFRFGFKLLLGSTREPGDSGDEGGYDKPDDKAAVVLHTFSAALLPDARPIHLYQPLRLSQGADLRVEELGTQAVGDGVPFMFIELDMYGLRISDYGAFEDGSFFPTIVDGPAAAAMATTTAPATVTPREGGDDGDVAQKGRMRVTFAMFSGGRLEVGGDFTRMSVVALPDRMLAIVDVVLACFMGPPAARQQQEMDALEEEVAMEEEEGAVGGKVDGILAPSSRQEALTAVQSAYLFFGRMDARITVRVEDFALLLVQNAQDSCTNVIMAQVRLQGVWHRDGSLVQSVASIGDILGVVGRRRKDYCVLDPKDRSRRKIRRSVRLLFAAASLR